MEVRCPHQCPEASDATIQVSSPCYWCPWYVSNRQIHEDLGVPLFADHIRALTASFNSKLADVGNTLVRQLGRYLRWTRVHPIARRESQRWQWPASLSRLWLAKEKSTKRIAVGADRPSGFRLIWMMFSIIFLSCKANSRVYDGKSGHGPHSFPLGAAVSPKLLKKSQTCLLWLRQSGLRTQTANQANFIPPTISPVPPRH